MLESGLIIAVVTFALAAFVGGFITPLCVPLMSLFLGPAAGYLAGVFEKPQSSGRASRRGAWAGAIGGAGALLGHVAAALITVALVGPERAAEVKDALGMGAEVNPSAYYLGAFGGGLCTALVDIALMAGLGALGGMLWYKMAGQK